MIRHYTSRAGDPHRHLHLQINARVYAAGAWRGLHSVGVRDSDRGDQRHRPRRGRDRPAVPVGARRARVDPRPGDRRDPPAGPVRRGVQRPDRADPSQRRPLRGRVARASTPARSRARGCARCGTGGRGREARPDKVVPTDGADLVARWNGELRELGYRDPTEPVALAGTRPGWIDRDAAADLVVSIARGEAVGVEHRRHPRGGRGPRSPRPASSPTRPREPSSPRTSPPAPSRRCVPLLARTDVPEHVRVAHLTSRCSRSRPTSSLGSPAARPARPRRCAWPRPRPGPDRPGPGRRGRCAGRRRSRWSWSKVPRAPGRPPRFASDPASCWR